MTTTDIKNLSIALEALSRIPKVDGLSTRIQGMLEEAIVDMEERSTRTPIYSHPPYVAESPKRVPSIDDIPF